jgi:hypothetical protein
MERIEELINERRKTEAARLTAFQISPGLVTERRSEESRGESGIELKWVRQLLPPVQTEDMSRSLGELNKISAKIPRLEREVSMLRAQSLSNDPTVVSAATEALTKKQEEVSTLRTERKEIETNVDEIRKAFRGKYNAATYEMMKRFLASPKPAEYPIRPIFETKKPLFGRESVLTLASKETNELKEVVQKIQTDLRGLDIAEEQLKREIERLEKEKAARTNYGRRERRPRRTR